MNSLWNEKEQNVKYGLDYFSSKTNFFKLDENLKKELVEALENTETKGKYSVLASTVDKFISEKMR